MEQTGTERYETYPTENLPNPHPEPVRSSYHPENVGERALSPPIFVRPLGPAVQLPRTTKPRSIMYKAKAHDLLIYASLIISALALILATKNGRQEVGRKGKEMMQKTSEIVEMVPQPGSEHQTQQPETIIHLKFPPAAQPPSLPPTLISPIQKFIAYIHPASAVSLPAALPLTQTAQSLVLQDLLRSIPLGRVDEGVDVLVLLEKLLVKDLVEEREREILDGILRYVISHPVVLREEDEGTSSFSTERKQHRHPHLRKILDILHPRSHIHNHDRAEEAKHREREKTFQEKETELNKRERAVVEALNVLAKEKEKD